MDSFLGRKKSEENKHETAAVGSKIPTKKLRLEQTVEQISEDKNSSEKLNISQKADVTVTDFADIVNKKM